MKSKEIYIVAGGPVEDLPQNLLEEKDVRWVGVDRGVYTLLQNGILPEHGFGDFDSVTSKERAWMESHDLPFTVYPSEKDHTDLEIALDWAINENPEAITMFGVTGGRLDHSWMNVQMLIKGVKSHIRLALEDRLNRLEMKEPGFFVVKEDARFPYMSFLAFTPEVKGLTLDGYRYPLSNQTISWGSSLCISNELVKEKGSYSFTEGILLVVRSSDAEQQL
ncbi:thiamine diphosphokinase [Pseudalkalibacillus hwajinpoensis]|uniref:Thiamine diphosphokinase n=1 Tax=Guptibacillus hwajinpoensis TaxID=208199 RepID=A0A4U1MMK6_9BACL|nr:thiamine diphosphokinase [Pseudalkalibacillus hwajinpoensis]TKD71700.1 thiamine diphosphokinase [Pseudalkalibacillus hwajinpoensis]